MLYSSYPLADYPENIELFLKLDTGLPRRFGTRISLTPMSGNAAAHLLIDLLKEIKLDAKPLEKQIATSIVCLANLPAWPCGGEIRTLASKVRTYQAAAFMQAIGSNQPQTVPVTIPYARDFQWMGQSYGNTCRLGSQGDLKCWGTPDTWYLEKPSTFGLMEIVPAL